MKRAKPTQAELRSMNRGKAVIVYPAGGGPARVEIPGRSSRAGARTVTREKTAGVGPAKVSTPKICTRVQRRT